MKLGGGDVSLADSLDERINEQVPGMCCELIYTSGTTGKPKGVMLSHDNISFDARAAFQHYSLNTNDDCMVSYLPLSHIAGQIADIFGPLATGTQIYFARRDALKGTLADTLKVVRPTLFFAVPRVWEKFMEKMKAIGAQNSTMKRWIGMILNLVESL